MIGLLATPGTIGRPYTDQLIASYASEARVIKHGSVELVKLAERHARGETVRAGRIYERVQRGLFDAHPAARKIDTVVLACTHFPLVREQLTQTAPRKITYIDSGAAIARQTLRVMPTGRVERSQGSKGYITDDPAGRGALVETLNAVWIWRGACCADR